MSNIVGPAAAKAALTSLLHHIQTSLNAAQAQGAESYRTAVDDAQRELEIFFKSTKAGDPADPDEVAAVRAIDQLAMDLIVRLSLDEMEANVELLEQGSEKLATQSASLAGATASNVQSATAIGLNSVEQALNNMTTMIESVKALKADLNSSNPDEAKVSAEIEKLVEQFEALRAAVSSAS